MNSSLNGFPEAGLKDKRGVIAYLAVAVSIILLMMVVGLLLRLAQGEVIPLPAEYYYQFMTLHGAAMVGSAVLAGAGVMWHFLRQYVHLSLPVMVINLITFLTGALLIIGATMIGGFAGGWTFLYPLPAISGGVWDVGAATTFLLGLLIIGTGFLLFYIDMARAILGRYGSLARGLGWPLLFGGKTDDTPPPAVVAATMVLVVNILAIASGAVVLVISIVNLYMPELTISPILAKNLIFFFGHTFINTAIYMAVVGVYEILPQYANRPWKTNRVFLAGWTASMVFVLVGYPHHLMMDFAMPTWALVVAQIMSYTSGLPVLVVTVFGALTLVYRSGIRWDIVSALLMLSMYGWGGGVIPAIVDATIVINKVMHNTLWVPGHFHHYLLIGMISMVFGTMYHLIKEPSANAQEQQETKLIDRLGFVGYVVGGLGFVWAFLYSGQMSVPRRWAVHLPEWVAVDQLAAVFAGLIVLSVLIFKGRFLARVPQLWREV